MEYCECKNPDLDERGYCKICGLNYFIDLNDSDWYPCIDFDELIDKPKKEENT